VTTTPALAAGQLRKLADALDAAADTPISANVSFSPAYFAGRSAGVAVVDALAEVFDVSAEPAMNGSLWYHEARQERDGVRLRVYTYIDAPAQRCACGAVCAHSATGGA